MRQFELAAKLGVVRSAVNHWEKSRSIPSGSMIIEVARALDCTIGELFGEGAS
jgi:transcriptional regulator with XRE-family HTH domain